MSRGRMPDVPGLDAPLNDLQKTVLRWVADGCPADRTDDNRYKLAARALENRRLVKVARRDGAWHATTTPAGDHHLATGEYPDDDSGRLVTVADAPVTPVPVARTPTPRAAAPPRRPHDDAEPAVARPGTPVARLMADLDEADGTVTVDPDGYARELRMLAQNAIRFGKVPAGRLLLVEGGWSGSTAILADAGERDLDTVPDVRVPARLVRPDPVVEAVRANPRLLPVTSLVEARAHRVLHALVTAMRARGHGVAVVRNPSGWVRDPDKALVRFDVDGHSLGVRLRQETDRTAHVPSPAEVKAQERNEWNRPPKWDEAPSGRLVLEIVDGRKYRTSEWREGKDGGRPVDGRLGEVVRELETRARLADLARAAAEVERDRRRREWEKARAHAEVLLVESHRADTLAAHADRWARARLLRDYLDALKATAAGREDPDGRAAEWIAWCEAHVARTDPLARPIGMPRDPEPTLQALQPFMRGHSPYGPPT